MQVYQQNQSLLAECLSEKVVEILCCSYAEGSTVMHLFNKASKLFHYEQPSSFLKSLEKHIIPYLITSDHTDIPKVCAYQLYQLVINTSTRYFLVYQ